MEQQEINLTEKQLLSQAFEAFNKTIKKLRKYQAKLEKQIHELTQEVGIKNQELVNILESLNTGLVVTDLEGKVIRFNQAAEEILEIESREAIGNHINKITPLSFIPENPEPDNMERMAHSHHQEHKFVNSARKKLILESDTYLMSSRDEKNPLGIIVNINDITLLKNLQEESDRKKRMVAMGQIAANVAHEIRNPLGSIELFVSLLKMDFGAEDEKTQILNHIHSGVRSMNHIISNILHYSRPRPISLVELDLNVLMKEFLNFSEHMARHCKVDVNFESHCNPAFIKGDEELLKQVLQNIFVNSIQSMPEGGTLEIKLDSETVDSPKKIALFKKVVLENTKKLKLFSLTFKDYGKGMPPSVVKQVFDPFFTTKEKGTGLGMYIIRNIIESHEGIISVESEVEVGTEVQIQFAALEREE